MTATANERRMDNFSAGTQTGRHGPLTVLRGAAWKRGWLLVAHGTAALGDRLMPYPTGGFNSAVTAANGGPLQIAGADANGGLRVIGKRPGIFIVIADAAAVAVTVTEPAGAGYLITINPILASTTAAGIVKAVRAHAFANELVDLTYTGTGAGLLLAVTTLGVPYIRIAGISGGEVDNTGDASNDLALTFAARSEQVFMGRWGMLFSGANSLNLAAPQKVWAADNQTVDASYAALNLPMWCSSYENGLAVCEIK